MLQERLQSLCARLRVVASPVDEDGTEAFFTGLSPVRFAPIPGGAMLECAVATLPALPEEREKRCREALRLTLSRTLREWGRHAGPTLVVKGNALLLQLRLSGDDANGVSPLMDQDLFDAAVERFLNMAETWVALLGRQSEPAATNDALSRFTGLWA